jgi:hypothetical protein
MIAGTQNGKNASVATDASSSLAFIAPPDRSAIEIRVNFGAFTGRNVMHAEIDRLAGWLLDEIDKVTIVAEDRHEIGRAAEGWVHQVRIDVSDEDAPAAPAERSELEQRLLERVDYWLRLCRSDRHVDFTEFDE